VLVSINSDISLFGFILFVKAYHFASKTFKHNHYRNAIMALYSNSKSSNNAGKLDYIHKDHSMCILVAFDVTDVKA